MDRAVVTLVVDNINNTPKPRKEVKACIASLRKEIPYISEFMYIARSPDGNYLIDFNDGMSEVMQKAMAAELFSFIINSEDE